MSRRSTLTPRALAAAVLAAGNRDEARQLLDQAPPEIAQIARTHINVMRYRRIFDDETAANRNFRTYRP